MRPPDGRRGVGAAAVVFLLLAGAAGPARAGEEGAVDWAAGVLEVVVGASGGGWQGWQVVEQRARDRADERIRALLEDLAVGEGRLGGDLLEGRWPEGAGDVLSRWLSGGRGGWREIEGRYHRSGDVEVVARLELARWLAPAIRSMARGPEPRPAGPGEVSGLVVDARGTGVAPALLGRILGPDGTVLYDLGSLHPATVDERLPVAWVGDPGHPAAVGRAGASPLFVAGRAGALAGDVVLDEAGTARVADRVLPEVVWSAAAVVVVVGP